MDTLHIPGASLQGNPTPMLRYQIDDQVAEKAIVARASQEWKSAIIDVGGGNRLLHFRNTSATLNLDGISETAFFRLLKGQTVKLTDLVFGQAGYTRALKACRALYRKQREATEEYGVSVTYLATGFASWDPENNSRLAKIEDGEVGLQESVPKQRGPVPNSPVLLRPLLLERKRGTQDVWEISLVDDFQANGVLLHVVNFDRPIVTEEAILDPLDAIDEAKNSAEIHALLAESMAVMESACSQIEGFRINQECVIGAFSYQKQPMVSDVENLEALGESDIVAALAGNLDAAGRVRSQASNANIQESDPDYAPVDSEYLVLDADASQSFVVNAALAGRNLVVQGPPGTGKSQTIANVIAALIASGKHILFVAQKRAALRLSWTD